MSKKETFEKFLKFMEKWHYEDFNAFETHFNKLLSMKGREQLTNENEALKDIIAVILAQKKNVNEQIEQLKQQLADKDKEIERLKVFEKAYYYNQLQASQEDIQKFQNLANQSAVNINYIAIQELEKVNGILTDTIIEVTQNEFDINKLCYLEEISAKFYEKIQQQIKELKGEK